MKVNSKEIMDEIKKNVEKKEIKERFLSFEDVPLPNYIRENDGQEDLYDMNEVAENVFNSNNGYNLASFVETESFQGTKGSFKYIIKKIINKLIGFVIRPLLKYQTFENAYIVRTLNGINRFMLDANNNVITRNNNSINIRSTINENRRMIYDTIQKNNEIDNKIESINETINNTIISKIEDLNETLLKANLTNEDNFFEKITVSQSGEDSIVAYVLKMLSISFEDVTYLDLGANHAKELSNTYYFYTKGAKGVLVEANPDLIKELQLYRSRDVVLNKCVNLKGNNEDIDFYILNGDGLSSFDKESVDDAIKKNPNLKIEKTVKVKSITINEIIEEYFDVPPTILNIDIEGLETEILEKIPFNSFRPAIIICEMIPYESKLVVQQKNDKILNILDKNNYIEYAFTGINSIFIDKNILKEKQQ